MLLTIKGKQLLAAAFDPSGRYLGGSLSDLDRHPDLKPPYDDWAESAIRSYMEWNDILPGEISVQKFKDRDRQIWIEDLPSYFAWISQSEDRIAEMYESREEMDLDRADWEESGRFVLKFQVEYWMDRDGSVNTT